jgi:hypothetical protein
LPAFGTFRSQLPTGLISDLNSKPCDKKGLLNLQTVRTVTYGSFIARAQWRMWHRPISVPLSWNANQHWADTK